MHGSVLHGFKQFVVARDGKDAWEAIVQAAGARGWYYSTEVYTDEEMGALVHATAAREARPVAQLLEDFGAALVPTLLQLYGSFVAPGWRTLDLLLNTERVIHRAIRISDPTASPPQLKPRRVSDEEVHIEYTSARRLCAVAVGICQGVAAHYGEHIVIEQPRCMLRGGATCLLVVRLMPPM